jgi:thiosulfate dehydrogenase [quinone] large subunit
MRTRTKGTTMTTSPTSGTDALRATTRGARPSVNVGVDAPAAAGVHAAVRMWAVLRIALGGVFLWAFLDKAFGLGFSTGRDAVTGRVEYFSDAAWINGGSPTAGFLGHGLNTTPALTDFYTSLAGHSWVDWSYMLSMLLVGLGLLTGVMTRLAVIGGVAWMAMMYSAGSIWPANNPVLDEHVIYAIALVGIAVANAGTVYGLGRRWQQLGFVQRRSLLR